MPISATQKRASRRQARQRQRHAPVVVVGGDARHASGRTPPGCVRSISLVVVLPTLPVTATRRPAKRGAGEARRAGAARPACRPPCSSALGGMPARRGAPSRPRAPLASASATKACPSPLSPRSATNRSPRPQRARVDRDAAGGERRPHGARRSPPAGRARVHRVRSCRARPVGGRQSTSSNGMTVPPIVWPCSWPLPATASTSPGPRPDSAVGDAPRAVADLARRRGRPARTAARIAAGSSLRGLSSVTMAHVGEARGRRAHQRALAAVAVAAGAEHHVQPARGMRAQRGQQPLQRVRRVGVVHIDRGAVRQPRRQLHAGRARRAGCGSDPARRRSPSAIGERGGHQGIVGLEAARQRQATSRRVPPAAMVSICPSGSGACRSRRMASTLLANRAQIEAAGAARSRARAARVAASISAHATAGAPCGSNSRTGAAWPRDRPAQVP